MILFKATYNLEEWQIDMDPVDKMFFFVIFPVLGLFAIMGSLVVLTMLIEA